MHKGRVVFGAMDQVVFGDPAAEAVVAQMDRLGAVRAFLMVSGTLNRQTGEIEKIRTALGSRCAATFDAMPPHTPREAVIAAAEQAKARGEGAFAFEGRMVDEPVIKRARALLDRTL